MAEELNVGLLMFIAHRAMENRVFAAVANAGYGDVTIAQARLMARISSTGSRLTTLAESAQVTKQTAGFLVDQLERAGYVERVPDPADGRARLVLLTDKAKEVLPLANGEAAAVEAEWEKHIGKRRMAQLRETLTMLREITDPYL
ncbi:MarR family transcriptional regulator [Lentzea sp. NBRC 105346]|uniref:MarR family winged helix-turn-helix transcriptional regulator n=1 Tax=Lentzea sp. NBRC 105346 TaxID=3032205 RepID=UPI0024A39EA3|nr:MarR family transcriptional regulator [Lentzea sp. NBRC 105346]GLZ31622.1 MarR family transcriptional regulator [Lentzea sp. NBRC 105346]